MKIDQDLVAISRAYVTAFCKQAVNPDADALLYEVFVQDQLRQAVSLVRRLHDASTAADTSELAIAARQFLDLYEKGGEPPEQT